MHAHYSLSTVAIAALATSANAAFGPSFSTGPVGGNSWIRESTSTLVLPKAPTGSSGDASLWVGMGTSNGDLIQSIADNFNANDWKIFAYTLLSTSANTQMPIQADGETAQPNDKVTMHCMSLAVSNSSCNPELIKISRQIRRRNRQLHAIRARQRPPSLHTVHQRRPRARLGQRRRMRRDKLRYCSSA